MTIVEGILKSSIEEWPCGHLLFSTGNEDTMKIPLAFVIRPDAKAIKHETDDAIRYV